MSVQNQIDRIIGLVNESHEKARSKGGTTATPLLANLPNVIDSIPEGVQLPPLSDDVRATASDMVRGKQLYDENGNVVTGDVPITSSYNIGVASSGELSYNRNLNQVIITDEHDGANGRWCIERDATITKRINADRFGNATAADVAKGKTFTSAAGLLVEGEALLPGGGSVYPDGAFAPVTSFTDGKQYALVATINGVRRYLNTTTFNNWTMNATEITIAEDAGDYVIFSATPALFTAMASGDGFLLQNGTNYLSGNDNSGSALRVNATQAVWTVDTSATAGLEEGKFYPKEDANAVWLFNSYKGYNWTIKFESANNSFGFDRNGRDSANSTGYVSFVLYEYVAGEGEVSPVVDTSDATATANDMADGVTAYVNGKRIEGNVSRVSTYGFPHTSLGHGAGNGRNFYTFGTYTESDVMIKAGAWVHAEVEKADLGDATAADVAQGKTFTSAAGVKVAGTATSGSTGATVASKTTAPTANSTSISFTGLTARPKMFSIAPKENISFSTSNRFVVNVMYDGTTTHGMYVVGSGSFNASYTGTYSAAYFTWTYSDGTLTVTTSSATNGGYFASGVDYQLTYAV